MKAYMFEGSPAEVAEALKAMGAAPSLAPAPANQAPQAEPEEDEDEEGGPFPLPPAVAKRLLSRRVVSEKLKKALIAIHEAKQEGILGSELCELLDYDPAQFRGMMGAFGRRMVNTDGYEENMSFFDWSWDAEEGYRYRLFDSSHAAVEAVLLK